MMKNIIGQSVYMTAALLVILLAGEYFIPEDCHTKAYEGQTVRFRLKFSIRIARKMGTLERGGGLIMIEVKIIPMVPRLNSTQRK
jgi:hypothetical protein